jgi:hypothetical protein
MVNPDNGTYFTSTVVGVSPTLSAVQIIIVIFQVRCLAAAKGMTKLELLYSVFTPNGLGLLSNEEVSASARDACQQTASEMDPRCTRGNKSPSSRVALVPHHSRTVVKVKLIVQEES